MAWPCQMVPRSKVGCIPPLVLCLQNWRVPKKCNTTNLHSPKQDGMRKSTAECNACHIFQMGGHPQKGASWCSSLLCTGVHPAHHPRKSKGGLASPVPALWVNPRVPLQAPSPEQHAGQQGNPYVQQDWVTVNPSPGQLCSKNCLPHKGGWTHIENK